MGILHNSTSVALWHDIILEAEASCKVILKTDIESYLVYLLIRYTNQPDMINQRIAIEWMNGIQLLRTERHVILQAVGDKCLLFSGLFPGIAKKRLVKLSYFIQLGQSAYSTISMGQSDVYHRLAKEFVPMMDVLQTIKQDNSVLLPLDAYDLWAETGSQRALAMLKQYTKNNKIFMKLPESDHTVNK